MKPKDYLPYAVSWLAGMFIVTVSIDGFAGHDTWTKLTLLWIPTATVAVLIVCEVFIRTRRPPR